MDVRVAKTVAASALAYLMCYIPFILFAVLGHQRSSSSRAGWPGFLAQFCVFLSNGINPVIYCFRTRRFRSALAQFLKDPCGKRPMQEPKKEQTAQWIMADRITRQAAGINKITHHLRYPCFTPKNRVANAEEESAVQSYKEAKYTKKEGQSSPSGRVAKS